MHKIINHFSYLSKAYFASLRPTTSKSALIAPSRKGLCLAQKLVPYFEEFTINIFLLLYQKQYIVMNDSTFQILTLEKEVHQMEAKVAILLEEELKQKNESHELQLLINSLQQRLKGGNSVPSEAQDYYLKRLEFLDQRLNNHGNTLQKYKQHYETLHGKTNSQLFNCQSQFYSNKQSNNHDRFQEKKLIQMNQSKMSIRSNNSRVNDNDKKKSLNVVCELQCENCGLFFKPYRYYSHINSCQKQSLIHSNISQSSALG